MSVTVDGDALGNVRMSHLQTCFFKRENTPSSNLKTLSQLEALEPSQKLADKGNLLL